jgi:hypothetical protein
MKTCVLFFLQVLFCATAIAQRKVIVPEGFGTLNEIIRRDTVAGGQRKDPKTIYVLRRGGVYVLSGTILTSGFDLRIEAEEGDGPRPYLVMGFLEGGTQVEEVFEVRGNLSMRGLYLTAVNELNTYIARVISASAANIRLSFYDCVIDGSGQTFVRLNSPGCKLYFLNTTISRMGRPSNPDNGRVIDDRGNQVDSIVVENNTWYNVTSRIVRDGGAEINYARFNQNTFVNVGQRLAAVGPINRFFFNNNIVVNPRFLGNTPTSTIVSLEFSPAGSGPVIDLSYNNFYYEAEIENAWAVITSSGSPRVIPPLVAAANQNILNAAAGIRNEKITFVSRPTPPYEFVIQSELANSSTIPDWDWAGAASGKPWEISGIAYHNFSYPSTTASFSGSSKNEPLGDLRWFPDFDVAWTVVDLVAQAEALISREQSNPVIGSSASSLAELQNAIANARLVAGNASAKGSELAAQRKALQQAIRNFRVSLIITEVDTPSPPSVFPNPIDNYVNVRMASDSWSFELRGMDGRVWQSGSAQQREVRLNLGEQPAGIYLLVLRAGSYQTIHKLLKR